MEAGTIEWERFKSSFLNRFFSLEMRDSKVLEFVNLRKVNVSVREYSLRFTQLSKYDSSIVVDHGAKMSMFLSSVSYMVVKECAPLCLSMT